MVMEMEMEMGYGVTHIKPNPMVFEKNRCILYYIVCMCVCFVLLFVLLCFALFFVLVLVFFFFLFLTSYRMSSLHVLGL